MDTSKTYIKMCDKAKEIQDIRQADDCVDRNEWWKSGDYVYSKDGEYIFNVCGVRHCAADTGYFSNSDSIWLPRQDQLQEMIKGAKHMHLLAYEFACYFHGSIDPLYANLGMDNYSVDADNSMEQMWLAFVMKEKYNKVWLNGEWAGVFDLR